MADRFENKGAMAATIVVAASDSLNKAAANYVCDGVNDHVEIQAALDALPATGGEVLLLDGTYYVEVMITLDSNQTLRGCGRNTILTTSTDDLVFLAAIGASDTEKTGIVISDLQIDGADVGDCGIYFEYVDHSFILNVYSRRHNYGKGTHRSGIYLINSDFNKIVANTFQTHSAGMGVALNASANNTIVGNICQGNTSGICLLNSDNNIIISNTCQGNNNGINLNGSSNNTVNGNTCQANNTHGILLTGSSNNTVTGNTSLENSQGITNTDSDIFLDGDSDYNNIQGNICRAGALANKPKYGIEISANTCNENRVTNNDLYDDGFGTASFNDAGTDTKLDVYVVPFSDGSDPQDSGFLIDVDTEMARAWLRLPDKVVQVVRMKVYARSVVLEADKMRAKFVIFGGADNEGYQTHNDSIANRPSTSVNFAVNDIIFWTVVVDIPAMLGGDSVEVKVLHEAGGNGDCATNAYFRTVEIEYV